MKREESRNFDVFLGVFVCFLSFWKRENVYRSWVKRKIWKNVSSLIRGVPGAIYSLKAFFEAVAFVGSPTALQGPPALKSL